MHSGEANLVIVKAENIKIMNDCCRTTEDEYLPISGNFIHKYKKIERKSMVLKWI